MRHKKSVAVFIFSLVLVFHINAQIDRTINSYVDSTEIFVKNGRKLLVEDIQMYNYNQALEVFNALNNRTSFKNCKPFSYNEELYIALLTSDWNYFFTRIEDYRKATSEMMCYPIDHYSARALYEELIKNKGMVKANFKNAISSNENIKLFELYMFLLENQGPNDEYYALLKSYEKTYPLSNYKDFVHDFLPHPKTTGTLTWSLGPMVVFPTDKLKANFNTVVGASMSMDVDIKRYYFSLYMEGGDMKLKTPFSVSSNGYDYNFVSGDKFNLFYGGINAGYSVIHLKKFHVAPYINLGGGHLESMLYPNNQDDDKEYYIFNSFIYGAGIHSELLFYNSKSKTSYDANMFLSLKLDAGYDIIAKYKHTPFEGNLLYVKLSLNMGFGNF